MTEKEFKSGLWSIVDTITKSDNYKTRHRHRRLLETGRRLPYTQKEVNLWHEVSGIPKVAWIGIEEWYLNNIKYKD